MFKNFYNNLGYYTNKCFGYIISSTYNFIYLCNHHMLPTFFNLFIIKSLLNTIKIFKIYQKVFNIFIIIYIATSKGKKNI